MCEKGAVTLVPRGITVEAACGETLLDALLRAAADFPWLCGGNCSCTTCAVEILEGGEGLSAPEWPELDRLRDVEAEHLPLRLACQALLVKGHVVVQRFDG